ncbi:hypothetical protein TVNIR_3641 [Thioalkalivibrio nitratireducens DSM 14787]|uniref:Uncharacterized protein n=1 Tax=Thioalkalivibrio nitratireducens (strain DSM 14787 / UNIQEM 213 / ALEN2) TaxID=1255043 RepID=L0E3M6_THIND|nr:hypothetical protein TVNIR_3641 [Thioalkalivibrio nitratireducens DSM 14787]
MLRIFDNVSGHIVAEWRGDAARRVLQSARLTPPDLQQAPDSAAAERAVRALLFEALVAQVLEPVHATRRSARVIPFRPHDGKPPGSRPQRGGASG